MTAWDFLNAHFDAIGGFCVFALIVWYLKD